MPARGAAKTAATQSPDATVANAQDASNATGLSILQLLAQSLDGEASSATPTAADSATPSADGTSGKSAEGSAASANTDPNAIALQLLSQALAAAFGGTPVPAQAASSGGASSGKDGAAGAIGDATRSANGSLLKDLVSLLAQDRSASSPGKSDTAPQQLNAPASKDAPADGTNAAASGPGSLAQPGAASHFSVQHSRSDTNTTTGELRSPVGSTAWSDELGGQLTWMTHQGIESGSLKLSPEHLGPVEVAISVQNGAASVWFGAHQADTRAALEQALPRLREMFASQGLTLSDSGVSRESPRNQSKPTAPQGVSAVAAIGAESTGSAALQMSLGLVDTYA